MYCTLKKSIKNNAQRMYVCRDQSVRKTNNAVVL